jgi:hypothetical protein
MRTYAELTHCVDLERFKRRKQMGRPLSKDINGVDVIGTSATTATGVVVQFYDTQLRADGAIIKQRGGKTFVVTQRGNITSRLNSSTSSTVCTLVATQPATAGEMRMQGSTTGNLDTGLVAIAKITKRVATDFSGNKYTWFLENDSSEDYIVLTAI